MLTITIWDTIFTGNIGDGWRDEREAADAYALALADALGTHATTRYPDATVDTRVTVQRASGYSAGLEVMFTETGEKIEVGEEFRFHEELGAIANQAWEQFRASDTARALLETD